MRENILQHAWGGLYFDFTGMKTQDGRTLQLLKPGSHNKDAGPDFSAACIRVDTLEMNGDIEIHVRGEEWYRHRHHLDPRYNSVMLHVVWEPSTSPILREDGTEVPEFVLRGRVPEALLGEPPAHSPIPCHGLWLQRRWLHWQPTVEALGLERIYEKARQLLARLQALQGDRRQLVWEEIAAGMGGMQNREAFRQLAQAVPRRLVEAHSPSLLRLEALLLGAAGLLPPEPSDGYTASLLQEWHHLARKHSLQPAALRCKFLRMRPGSLPPVRVAQLAAMVHSLHFLEELFSGEGYSLILERAFAASDYWDTHHVPGEESHPQKKRIGRDQKLHLILNTLLPLEVLLHSHLDRVRAGRVLMAKMRQLPPENNSIIRTFAPYAVYPSNALEGQGLIALQRQLCSQHRCLECGIGRQLVSRDHSIRSGD